MFFPHHHRLGFYAYLKKKKNQQISPFQIRFFTISNQNYDGDFFVPFFEQFLWMEHNPFNEFHAVKACSSAPYLLRYLNIIRWRNGYITAEDLEVNNWKVEIIAFVIEF